MNRFMYGLDYDEPSRSAARISEMGYDGVVLPSSAAPVVFEAAREAGLETWMCYGAHSIGRFSQDGYGALDAKGQPAPWLGSACPNDAEVNAFNMASAIEKAKCVSGLAGIIVDGARFASFASAEGIGSFFGCFCPRCMDKMGEMGYDAEKLKSGVAMLMEYINGGEGDIPAMRDCIEKWFNFRTACVKKYMDNFAENVHNLGLKAGAFVFAPSLWWFVGQRADACSALDVVSPMLYRAYPHEDGPACLSHEWARFAELLSHGSRPASELASLLFDMPLMSDNPMAGFSPEHVGFEVSAARAMLNKGIRLMPIIQTEDAELEKVYDAVMNSGADGCGEFMYSQKAAFARIN